MDVKAAANVNALPLSLVQSLNALHSANANAAALDLADAVVQAAAMAIMASAH